MNIFTSAKITEQDIIIKHENIIVVPSIIKVSNVPLDGYTSRSYLSTENRYSQTIEQLKSIKTKIPDATVLLLETSIDLNLDWINNLSTLCDYIILYQDHKEIRYLSNDHPSNKGLGEIGVLCHIYNLLKNKNFKYFFKFGGRYKFNETFIYDNVAVDIPVVCSIKYNTPIGILAQTVFYSIPFKYFDQYYKIFSKYLSRQTMISAEHILTLFLEAVPYFKNMEKIGVEGYGGVAKRYNIL